MSDPGIDKVARAYGFGFEDLSDDACRRVLANYRDGLARYASGEIKSPCGSSARTVRRWEAELLSEMVSRGIALACTPALARAASPSRPERTE